MGKDQGKTLKDEEATGKGAKGEAKKKGKHVEIHAEPAPKASGGAPKNTLEDNINLEVLMQLKSAFSQADNDGGGDLDMEEFVEAFSGILGNDLSGDALRQMFMKIDANADGRVDWDEFSTFMLLQNQGKQSMQESEIHAEYVEESAERVQDPHQHRDMVDHIFYMGHGDRYATTSRDGTLRFWSGKDLNHLRTLKVGRAWITDIGLLRSQQNKLVVSTFNRALQIYDVNSLEVVGKLTELEHTPLSVDCWAQHKADVSSDRLATGDDGGFVQLYAVSERDDEEKILSGDHWRVERLWKNAAHSDWVSKVMFMPDLSALCSCSLDRTLCLLDVERRGVLRTLVGHTKGVYSFDWSQTYKFIASCGMDRHVLLWNPFSARPMASLTGHSASVQDVLIVEPENQIVTLGVDKTIKVWDIRNHKCLQTITDKTMYRPENRMTAIHYDAQRRQLVTAATRPKAWPLRSWEARSGMCHSDSVACALYNPNFHQVVSGDHSSNVCVWEVETGKMRFRFGSAHGTAKITAMAFDKAHRRLITGAHDGSLKVWNFSNGSCLKELINPTPDEITGIEYVQGGYHNKHVIAVGWNRKVSFWEDGDKKQVETSRRLSGHVDDILTVALWPPSTLATGSYDGVIIIWNIDSGAIKMKLQADNLEKVPLTERAVEKVLFLQKHSGTLACCGADRYLRLWNCVHGHLCLEVLTGQAQGESVLSMCTDPEDHWLVTGDSTGVIKIWDISMFDGQPVAGQDAQRACREVVAFQGHAGAVSSMEYVSKGDMLVTSGSDCQVTLWSISGARVGDFGRDTWLVDDRRTWRSLSVVPIEAEAAAAHITGGDEVLDLHPEGEESEGEESYEDGMAPMQIWANRKAEKAEKERKLPPMSQRIYLPGGNKGLNHPHTPGRPPTSIHHLLHIHDLNDLAPRPDTSTSSDHNAESDGRKSGGMDGMAAYGARSAAPSPTRDMLGGKEGKGRPSGPRVMSARAGG